MRASHRLAPHGAQRRRHDDDGVALVAREMERDEGLAEPDVVGEERAAEACERGAQVSHGLELVRQQHDVAESRIVVAVRTRVAVRAEHRFGDRRADACGIGAHERRGDGRGNAGAGGHGAAQASSGATSRSARP